LHIEGLNLEIKFTNAHVNDNDLVEVFGPKCIFKVTNPFIHADTKHELKKLHWQIYGVAMPTNNNFILWLIKGYIA
jgi:hypothetical protein